MGVVSRFSAWRDKALTARHECWLIVGLFVTDLGASLPFGVSNTDPNASLTLNEWISSALLGILAFVLLWGMFNKRVLSWAGLVGGMVWMAVAAGTFHDNFIADGSLPMTTKIALVFIPLGIAMSHLSLERYVERPKNSRATDRTPE